MHRRSNEFNVGEYVMVHIRLERIPKMFSKKLYAKAMGPYSIICKLGSNAYLLDLPNYLDISHVFNVEDLLPYRDTFKPSSVFVGETSKGAPIVPSLQYYKEMVNIILDDEFVTSRDCGFHRFLVKCMIVLILMLLGYEMMIFVIWIFRYWIVIFPLTLWSQVLFNPKGIIGHRVGPYLSPKQDRKLKSNNNFYFSFNRTFWICLLGFSVGVYK